MEAESEKPKKPPLWNSCRLIFSVCMFIAFFFQLCMRLNLSLSLRCMVKRPLRRSLNTIPKSEHSCALNNERARSIHLPAEFAWTKAEEGLLLSSFFYGYLVGQPLGGVLCQFCKSKKLLICSLFLQSVCTLILPVFSRLSLPGLIALKVFQGIVGGLLLPAIYQMFSVWAHPTERATLMSFAYSGFPVGTVVIFPISSAFCQTDFDNGWPMGFYTIGGICLIFSISLIWLIYEDAATHPRISPEEYAYLPNKRDTEIKSGRIPLLKMITSIPIITFCVVHFCQSFCNSWLTLSTPQYMEETLYVNIKWNGLYSAAPFIGSLCTRILLALTYTRIFMKTHLTLTIYRKIFHLSGCLSAGFILLAISFLNCNHSTLVVALFGCMGALQDLCFIGSYWTSYLELAPAYAGFLSGFTNILSTLTGIITPNIVASIVQVGTKQEWNLMLYILMSMYTFSALVYTAFGSSDPLPWGQYDKTIKPVEDEQK